VHRHIKATVQCTGGKLKSDFQGTVVINYTWTSKLSIEIASAVRCTHQDSWSLETTTQQSDARILPTCCNDMHLKVQHIILNMHLLITEGCND